MTKIYNLSDCQYSNRHGTYGGAAGDKDGILINGDYWIVKYPKPEREFDAPINMSYNTSPVSEYIGSHIYETLGIPVHQTILGVRNNKLVVACKDFCEFRGQLTEMRTIKNGANHELEQILDREMHYSSTGERVNLNEMLLHLEHNPILQMCDGVKERFWDTVIVDLFIDNTDRNNGNWGLLFDEKNNLYHLAPVYDNGNAFFNKMNDEKMTVLINKDEKVRNDLYCGSRTAYDYNGKILSAKKLAKLDINDLKLAANRIIPTINQHMSEIEDIIDALPENVGDIVVCSKIRKECYKQALHARRENILLPMLDEQSTKQKMSQNKSCQRRRHEEEIEL